MCTRRAPSNSADDAEAELSRDKMRERSGGLLKQRRGRKAELDAEDMKQQKQREGREGRVRERGGGADTMCTSVTSPAENTATKWMEDRRPSCVCVAGVNFIPPLAAECWVFVIFFNKVQLVFIDSVNIEVEGH